VFRQHLFLRVPQSLLDRRHLQLIGQLKAPPQAWCMGPFKSPRGYAKAYAASDKVIALTFTRSPLRVSSARTAHR